MSFGPFFFYLAMYIEQWNEFAVDSEEENNEEAKICKQKSGLDNRKTSRSRPMTVSDLSSNMSYTITPGKERTVETVHGNRFDAS